jgi:hypothetical protein
LRDARRRVEQLGERLIDGLPKGLVERALAGARAVSAHDGRLRRDDAQAHLADGLGPGRLLRAHPARGEHDERDPERGAGELHLSTLPT